eukprot:scaffold254_cov129-Isochrysis_galbana.AAC.2
MGAVALEEFTDEGTLLSVLQHSIRRAPNLTSRKLQADAGVYGRGVQHYRKHGEHSSRQHH